MERGDIFNLPQREERYQVNFTTKKEEFSYTGHNCTVELSRGGWIPEAELCMYCGSGIQPLAAARWEQVQKPRAELDYRPIRVFLAFLRCPRLT